MATSFDEVVELLRTKKNIIVLCGAGISVSCGIPDFRSANGLYNTLNYEELGLTCAEDLFDFETFTDDPRPFFRFAHSLYPGSTDPGQSHKFLAWLDGQGMLLRIYTQNIDALELAAGVRKDKLVYAHGSLDNATCMKCKAKYTASDIANDVQSGTVPLCQRPRNKKAKISSGRKSVGIDTDAAAKEVPPIERRVSLRRAAASSTTTSTKSSCNYAISMQKGLCSGVIKPNVTFFGEKLSNDVGCKLQRDSEKADALIVMGTSLSVAPMSRVVEYLKEDIPRILINRNIVRVRKAAPKEDGDCLFHACLLGNCDDVVNVLVQKMKGNDSSSATAPNSVMNDEKWLHNQPKGSVFLFPGAERSNSQSELDDEIPQPKLVVHCDECEKTISGNVYTCTTCFGFDLCGTCYIKTTHAKGKHKFILER